MDILPPDHQGPPCRPEIGRSRIAVSPRPPRTASPSAFLAAALQPARRFWHRRCETSSGLLRSATAACPRLTGPALRPRKPFQPARTGRPAHWPPPGGEHSRGWERRNLRLPPDSPPPSCWRSPGCCCCCMRSNVRWPRPYAPSWPSCAGFGTRSSPDAQTARGWPPALDGAADKGSGCNDTPSQAPLAGRP